MTWYRNWWYSAVVSSMSNPECLTDKSHTSGSTNASRIFMDILLWYSKIPQWIPTVISQQLEALHVRQFRKLPGGSPGILTMRQSGQHAPELTHLKQHRQLPFEEFPQCRGWTSYDIVVGLDTQRLRAPEMPCWWSCRILSIFNVR